MKRQINNVTLGEKYKDKLHEIEGIATCYAVHLTGCNRVAIEWLDKDGNPKDIWLDETRLTHVESGKDVVPSGEEKPGPGADPARRGIK